MRKMLFEWVIFMTRRFFCDWLLPFCFQAKKNDFKKMLEDEVEEQEKTADEKNELKSNEKSTKNKLKEETKGEEEQVILGHRTDFDHKITRVICVAQVLCELHLKITF